MKREEISEAVGNIDARHIREAGTEAPVWKKGGVFQRPLFRVAAAVALCLIAGVFFLMPSHGRMTVTAYSLESDQEITASGAVISTGLIRDNGSMTGKPLMFYLSGENIVKVRFSCKNEKINFVDWTEKREEYGQAQNFTVEYGPDEKEYYYLTIDWIPERLIRELKGDGSTIAGLSKELREDTIVMEISFEDGSSETKAITVSLQDDGRFFAAFQNYKIKDTDSFVKRSDSRPIPREVLYAQGADPGRDQENPIRDSAAGVPAESAAPGKIEQEKPDEEQIEKAREAAEKYYAGTVFEVVSLEVKSLQEEEIVFTSRVKKGGVVQDPDRSITLRLKEGQWKVANEGY